MPQTVIGCGQEDWDPGVDDSEEEIRSGGRELTSTTVAGSTASISRFLCPPIECYKSSTKHRSTVIVVHLTSYLIIRP